MAYYFSEHICILLNMTCHITEHFVLRSEAALYFRENVCVSVNKIHYFCQHLLFHPEKTSYFGKKICCFIMTLHVISENTCSAPLDMTFHFDVQFGFSSWYGILFQRIFVAFRSACLFISGKTLSCSYNKSQRDALFLNFVLVKNSTCFRQIYCPSSGVLTLYSQQLVFVILVMLTVC